MDKQKYILPFSAKSRGALENTSGKIIEFLKANDNVSLADASWTLQSGRRAYNYRKTVVVNRTELQNGLPQGDDSVIVATAAKKWRSI